MLTSSSSVADHVDAFLAQKRMLGTCAYSSKNVVKTAGARWDNDSKKWYAPNEVALLEMLQTNVWHPECLASGQQMLGVLMKRKEEERNEAKKKEEAERKRKEEERLKKQALCDSRDLVIPDSTPEELAELKERVVDGQADVAVIDTALSPIQQRNLEKAWNVKVIDRTGLILEIFGQRARTKEGVLQVELARLAYERSRLVRTWTHLERQRGGRGGGRASPREW